jgi:signal transduction histidine kinase
MKQKISLLITGCILTVIALAFIQGYFIYNTYLLRARNADGAITQKLLKLETTGKLDSINTVWMKNTSLFIDRYKKNEAGKKDYVKLIDKISDSLSAIVEKHISKKGIYGNYDVSYANYVTSIIVHDPKTAKNDTLFNGKMALYSNNAQADEETQASQSTWRSDTSEFMRDTTNQKIYNFEVVSKRFYSIPNWKKEVLLKMSGLLIFSVLLFIFVVLLFYLSIKSLITQKKNADIKADFINNITHEFQTPLAALDIAVKTLTRKEGELDAQSYRNTLAIIDRQNQRMQKLFSQVTRASVAATGTEAGNIRIVEHNEVAGTVNDFSLSHPGVSINCVISDSAVIKIDPFHLNTILLNLLDNAVKYGADSIIVSIEGKGQGFELSVKDNGKGIAEKEQAAIFEKFYRAEKGNIHNTKGLGLGLYYIQQIVNAYKGTVKVESSEGKGSVFTIIIPAL